MKKSVRTMLLLSVFTLATIPCAFAGGAPTGTDPEPPSPHYLSLVVSVVLNILGL